jgi:hypothetical protein
MAIDSPGAGAATGGGTAGTGSAEPHRSGVADQLRNRASDALAQQKHRATEGLGSIVDAVRSTGRQLGDTNQPGIARYVNNAADSLQRWVSTFDRKDVREIVEDVQQFGRRQPALFMGITFGAGLLGARFLKSSARDDQRSYRDTSFSYGERDTMGRSGRDTYTAQRTTGTVGGTSYGSSGNRT